MSLVTDRQEATRMAAKKTTSRRVIARLMVFVVGIVGLTVSTVTPVAAAPSGPVTPNHVVTCNHTPYIPTRAGNTISYGVAIQCNDSVDIRTGTIKLWRWSAATGYKNVASKSTSNTAADFFFGSTYACTPTAELYVYHTYYYVEAFHGTWGLNEGNSGTDGLHCK